jgi:DNA-binding MarR family transcriptional regulator
MPPVPDLAALMALRCQGLASRERLADALGVKTAAAAERMRTLLDDGLCTERTGRLAGFTLTAAGNEALEKSLAEEALRGSDDLLAAYDRFLDLNRRLLRVASDWQVRRHGQMEAPNDHSDPLYDAEVIGKLVDLHDAAKVVLRRMRKVADRFGTYLKRLDGCVARLEDGDRAAFTAPMAESYHTVWFELHQDLLLTLGLEREDDG